MDETEFILAISPIPHFDLPVVYVSAITLQLQKIESIEVRI